MHTVVLMNARSGPGPVGLDQVRLALGAEVRVVRGAALPFVVKELAAESRWEALVACGGDGTVSLVAGECVRAGKVLGVIPAGTLNHFAQDLGLPAGVAAAARVIERGRTRLVDVGQVNGRVFLNNVSIGLYPAALREREERRHRLGWGKWGALVVASLTVLRQLPRHRLRLIIDEYALERKTPFAFVGNNLYELGQPGIGRRSSLEGGKLSVLVSHHRSRTGLLVLALKALLGWLDNAGELDAFQARSVILEQRRHELSAGVDGELVRLATPLRFQIRPRALRVLVP